MARRRRKNTFVEGAIGLAAGGAAFGIGTSLIGSLPDTAVSGTASRAIGIGSMVMPIAAGGMVLGELGKLERLGKKKRRRR